MLALFVIVVVGGLTGIMIGAVLLDLQVHDTCFVVAHLHYVVSATCRAIDTVTATCGGARSA